MRSKASLLSKWLLVNRQIIRLLLMPARVPSRRSSVSSILPPRLPAPNVVQLCSKDDHSACNAPVHQTCRCCRHTACRRSSCQASNHRVQCCTWSSTKQRDGPTTHSRDVSAEGDSRFPPPEPTCLPQRFHDKLECTLRLVPGSDDCRADRALVESDALGRSQSPSPVISSQVHQQRVTQHQCDPTFPTSAPQPQLSQQTNPSLTALPQWKDREQPAQLVEHPVLDHT